MERPVLVYLLIFAGIAIFARIRASLDSRPGARRFFEFFGRIEVGSIATLLAALIILGCLQIVLRNFINRGILWADPLMRHIVLWLGCLGGAVATTKVRHITIDVLSRYLTGRLEAWRDRIVYFATAVATSILGFASLGLVIQEREYGDEAFLSIETWMLQTILPFAFFLITYRSLLNLLLQRKAKPLEWDPDEGGGGS